MKGEKNEKVYYLNKFNNTNMLYVCN